MHRKDLSEMKTKIHSYQLLIICTVIIYGIFAQQSFASQTQYNNETIIREMAARTLSKLPDDLKEEDFNKITELEIRNIELTDITYLEKFTNLQKLDIQNIRFPKSEIIDDVL